MAEHKLHWKPRLVTAEEAPKKDDKVIVVGLLAKKYPNVGTVTLVTNRKTFVKFPGVSDSVGLTAAFLKKQ